VPAVPVDADHLRLVLGRYATGVVVVTCVQDGLDHAMTANSFTSVSLDPPLVLVCVELDTRFHEAVLAAGTWSVSVLRAGQRGRATWFATRGRPLVGQFASTPTERSAATGALHLLGALATVDVATEAVHRAGDHDIVVGRVLALEVEEGVEPDPLLFVASRYERLQPGESGA
jgi:flavin reductase (DIM6/NTAB) family NADH-FMN oxidoreductase RutF